jgi:hypothetical protein
MPSAFGKVTVKFVSEGREGSRMTYEFTSGRTRQVVQ